MFLRILKGVVQLVILLIVVECVTPVFTIFDGEHSSHFALSSKKAASSSLTTMAFQKVEEEYPGQPRSKSFLAVVVDLTHMATVLSETHTRPHSIGFDFYSESQPALFKLFCVYLV